MTNNENENDIDIDGQQEDFEKEPQQKASLKETWDSNPLLKIAAVLLGLALLGGGYFAFIGNKPEENISVVGSGSDVKQTVGAGETDINYQKKVEAQNKKNAEEAAQSGGSAIPTPIQANQTNTLAVPTSPAAPAGDPLAEWRAKTEAKRLKMEQEAPPEDKEAEQPEIMPIVQPIHPQPTMKMDPNAARQLAEQMRTVISTQTPAIMNRISITTRQSAYTVKVKKDEDDARAKKVADAKAMQNGTMGADGKPTEPVAKAKVIVTAGSIAYAQLINDLNSDVKGPALAQILSGPFEGGRAIGQFSKQDEYLTLNFNKIIKDGASYSVQAIAMDENTSLTGLTSDVDHHYIARIIVPAAANFIKGYAQAAATPPTTTTTTAGGGVASDNPAPTVHEQLMKGVEEASSDAANILKQDAPKDITVKLWHGTTMGLLFTAPVTTGSVDQ
jgi:hypothetical protein